MVTYTLWTWLCENPCMHTLYLTFLFQKNVSSFWWCVGLWSMGHFPWIHDRISRVNKKAQIKEREFVKPYIIFRKVFFLQSMLSLNWRESVMKLWAKLNKELTKVHDHTVREIKTLQLDCIFFEDALFNSRRWRVMVPVCIRLLLHISCPVVLMMFGLVDF